MIPHPPLLDGKEIVVAQLAVIMGAILAATKCKYWVTQLPDP
jgi:hypothetical protein